MRACAVARLSALFLEWPILQLKEDLAVAGVFVAEKNLGGLPKRQMPRA
jgi:hypothetical protein